MMSTTPYKRRDIALASRQVGKTEAMRAYMQKRRERWKWEKKIGRIHMDAHEHINRQCWCFGVSFNWNFLPGIEIEFFIWTFHVELGLKTKRSAE